LCCARRRWGRASRAFNDDLPFDQFTIRQLAGDQLESATADDLLATAFHRNTQNNTEGGTSDEEFRAAAVVDRINTTWTAWQATTFGCVQCHAHPYDPYPHEDYYRVMAFFDNTEDTDLEDDFPRLPVAHDPAQRNAVAAQWRERRSIREALNAQGVETAIADATWQPLAVSQATTSGASFGAWSTYGLGSENDHLPGFIVLTSGGKNPDAGKSVWGAGYLPSVYQGVQCRSSGEPVLFLQDPAGIDRAQRRRSLDALAEINQRTAAEVGDPETLTRIAQYEMAFRMQVAAADAFDLTREPQDVHELYGTQPGRESFANNCLLARRLAERGVRFIQLFDWGWDSHGAGKEEALNHGFKNKCESIDRACYALLTDLKRRGLLDDTLVIWGGEFGRTPMRENRNGVEMAFIGRDHNPGAFTLWMAGGGVRPGLSYGATDDFGYQSVIDRVSVHDFHATVLALLGFDHMRFNYSVNGVAMRLSNVTKPGSWPVAGILS
jgi:hypothetical protein